VILYKNKTQFYPFYYEPICDFKYNHINIDPDNDKYKQKIKKMDLVDNKISEIKKKTENYKKNNKLDDIMDYESNDKNDDSNNSDSDDSNNSNDIDKIFKKKSQ
jgi:hypothetical protein